MKVLLVRPPQRGFELPNRGQGRNHPIGLAYLVAAARTRGYQCSIFDALSESEYTHFPTPADCVSEVEREKLRRHPGSCTFIHVGSSWDHIEDTFRRERPDVIGISSMFSSFSLSAHKVAAIAKSIGREIIVIAGGADITIRPEVILRDPNIDCILVGEAENSFPELLDRLRASGTPMHVPGAGFRCGGPWCMCAHPCSAGIHLCPRAPWNFDLDKLPFPDNADLDWSRYDHSAALITSRGCPLSCTFCSIHPMVGRAHRARSPANVVDEIEWYISKHGIRRFSIEDDNFTWNVDRVHAICKEIRRRGIRASFRLPNGITAIGLSDSIAREMVEAGFEQLFIGLETTNPEILRNVKKGFTSLEKVKNGVAAFKKHDPSIRATGVLISGLRGQQVEDVARDVVGLVEHGVMFGINPLYPVPGAPDRMLLAAEGKLDLEEDPAMVEPYSFHRGFELDSPSMYWAYIAALACIAPPVARLILWAVRRHARSGQHGAPMSYARVGAGVARLMDGGLRQKALGGLQLALGILQAKFSPYWPRRSTARSLRIAVHVAAIKMLSPESFAVKARAPHAVHGMFADIISAAMSMASGTSIRFREASCSCTSGSRRPFCVFEASGEPLPSEAEAVIRSFCAVMREKPPLCP